MLIRRLTLRVVALAIMAFLALPFMAFAGSNDVVFTWNPNTESDLAGYKLYQGTVSGKYGPPVDLGNVTTYTLTLPALTVDQTYFFALTAYDKSTNESGKSSEVSKLIVGVVPVPATPPTVVLAVQGDPTTGPWAVEAVASGVADPYDIEVWVNGVLDHIEGASPRCSWGDAPTGGTCLRVLKPAGSYVMEFRVIQAGVQVAKASVTVLAVDTLAPAPPTGFTVK